MKKVRVKPSKEMSLLLGICGLIMVGVGVFVVIPNMGMFGIFWTLMAGAMAGYSLVGAFSDKGIATQEIDIEGENFLNTGQGDLEYRLENLERVRQKGLITDEEYQRKRSEILARF